MAGYPGQFHAYKKRTAPVVIPHIHFYVAQPTDWTIKINKKERRLAVATALQSAASDMKVIEDIKVSLPN